MGRERYEKKTKAMKWTVLEEQRKGGKVRKNKTWEKERKGGKSKRGEGNKRTRLEKQRMG